MVNNILFVKTCLLVLLYQSTRCLAQSNDTCIIVTLYDAFGDGWEGAMWYIETPKTPISPASPNCSHNPLVKRICGEKGQYYMMVLSADEKAPENFWEILWTVKIEGTVQLFTGGFNTTMVFDYTNGKWTLIHHHNLWPNSMELTTCGSTEYVSAQECLPEPKSSEVVYSKERDSSSRTINSRSDDKKRITQTPVSSRIVGRNKERFLKEKDGEKKQRISRAAQPTKRPTKDRKKTSASGGGGGGGDDENTNEPSVVPTWTPTVMPSAKPTYSPTPTNSTRPPSHKPTTKPSAVPTYSPTGVPTGVPTADNKKQKAQKQKVVVVKKEKKTVQRVSGAGGEEEEETDEPTVSPSWKPTVSPTTRPTHFPTPENYTHPPTARASAEPSWNPTGVPTSHPTSEKEGEGGMGEKKRKVQKQKVVVIKKEKKNMGAQGGGGEEEETDEPTVSPSWKPTVSPTTRPTHFPTPQNYTHPPTARPSAEPSWNPTGVPTSHPTSEKEEEGGMGEKKRKVQKQKVVVVKKERRKVGVQGGGEEDEEEETDEPTVSPSWKPTVTPTTRPTHFPTPENYTHPPSGIPTGVPTGYPTTEEEGDEVRAGGVVVKRERRQKIEIKKKEVAKPSNEEQTVTPTRVPSRVPTVSPTVFPSIMPTHFPTPTNMTHPPTGHPSGQPSGQPSSQPTGQPTSFPTPVDDASSRRKRPAPVKKEKIIFERTPEKAKPVKPTNADCPADLKVLLYSPSGEGWYNSNYQGTMFYISDESKSELIAYGTLAEETSIGFCEYCFGEGSYYFRLAADQYHHDAKWSFCGTSGSFSEQLSFHIEDCECVPDALLDLDMVCEENYSSVVTLSGKLALEGFQSEIFSKSDKYVIANALASSVSGWEADNINIYSSNIDLREPHGKGRSLAPYTITVDFEVSFVSEIAYSFDGMSRKGVEELVEDIAGLLKDAMSSGDFVSMLDSVANEANNRQMAKVRGAEALSLQLLEVTYVGTKAMEIVKDSSQDMTSDMLKQYSSAETHVYSQYYHGLVFGVILSVGVLVFVGALGHSLRARRYEDLISKFVDPAESDLAVSNHLRGCDRSTVSVSL